MHTTDRESAVIGYRNICQLRDAPGCIEATGGSTLYPPSVTVRDDCANEAESWLLSAGWLILGRRPVEPPEHPGLLIRVCFDVCR